MHHSNVSRNERLYTMYIHNLIIYRLMTYPFLLSPPPPLPPLPPDPDPTILVLYRPPSLSSLLPLLQLRPPHSILTLFPLRSRPHLSHTHGDPAGLRGVIGLASELPGELEPLPPREPRLRGDEEPDERLGRRRELSSESESISESDSSESLILELESSSDDEKEEALTCVRVILRVRASISRCE